MNPENYCILRRHRLLGQTTTQPLRNFEPKKPWRYTVSNFEGSGLILVAYKKINVLSIFWKWITFGLIFSLIFSDFWRNFIQPGVSKKFFLCKKRIHSIPVNKKSNFLKNQWIPIIDVNTLVPSVHTLVPSVH